MRYQYEVCSFTYYKKPYKPVCLDCGSKNVASERSYTPDFYLPDQDIYVETKGKFTPGDRKKMQLVKRDNPDIDLRIVFMSNNKTTKRGTKRYSDWAEYNGFLYAIGDIPDEWFKHR